MKKFLNLVCLLLRQHRKKLIVMRNTVLIVLISALQVFATGSYAQTKTISLAMNDATIREVLYAIQKQSEFYFLYNSELIDVAKKVDITIEEEKVDKILTRLFNKNEVDFLIKDRYIVLTPVGGNAELFDQRTVSGTVTDQSGQPLPGVTVLIKGTTQGTVTNTDGNYSLSNIPEDATLVYSFVGMRTQEVVVGGQISINIVMEQETIGIEEVVAIGYGTISKKDLTGSVSSVRFEDQILNANINVMQAMQGYLPGLNIGAVTESGEDPSLLIRGTTSLSTGQSPLIVVDGVIYNGSISDISTSDIERIDVLKDASSAAIFGSRSANGVIIITTKQGKSEKPVFDFNTYHGAQVIANKYNVCNANEYIKLILDYRSANGMEADINNMEAYLDPLEGENYRNGTENDWGELMTQAGPISQYDLSVSGSTARTNYYLSGSFTDQEGAVMGDDFTHTSLRANFSNDISNWLTIGMNAMYSNKDYSGVALPYSSWSLLSSPLGTIYDETGDLVFYPHNKTMFPNPLLNQRVKDSEVSNNLFSVLYADIKIPKIEGLKYHFDYSDNLRFEKHHQFWGTNTVSGYQAPNGHVTRINSENRSWLINNILSYSRQIKKHQVEATIVYSREGYVGESSNLTAKNFSSEVLEWNAIELAGYLAVNTNASENNTEAFMSRFLYNYDNKYYLTATFRRDGFSGFPAGGKYANFPSASLGWVISEEDFTKSLNWINFLKLRLSYGVNGNQALGAYSSLSKMELNNYVYDKSSVVAIYSGSMGNNDLTWEKTKSWNFGIDFSVLNNRLSGEINVYKSNTTDQLVERSLPSMTGYNNVWTNLGEVQNKGIEVELNSIILSTSGFIWKSHLSFSLNRNKIVHLYGTDTDGDGKEDDDIGNSWFIGKSIGAIYNYKTDGIYQIDDDIPDGFVAGKFRPVDVDGSGELDENDRTVIGCTEPNFRVGFYNEMKYKNISLSFMINSIQGGGKNNYYLSDSRSNRVIEHIHSGASAIKRDYWTLENPTNEYPGLYYGGEKYQPAVLEDRSFVRLQDITLAYGFSKTVLNKLGVNNLKIYLSGKNLLTLTKKYKEKVLREEGYFTNFTGMDPEAGTNLLMGTPVMRTYIIGLNINF